MKPARPNYRIFLDVLPLGDMSKLTTVYSVQRRTDSDEWETVYLPANLTEATFTDRDVAEAVMRSLAE